jgi:hypothetical protein
MVGEVMLGSARVVSPLVIGVYGHAVRTMLVGVLIVGLACCGDDDDGGASSGSVAGPTPSDDVTAAEYAEEWNSLSQSLQVSAEDNEAPSTESGNWQLRLDVEASDVDEGWVLMQDFAAQFGCDLPARQPRDDTLVVDC